jgi:hypothetical protein
MKRTNNTKDSSVNKCRDSKRRALKKEEARRDKGRGKEE